MPACCSLPRTYYPLWSSLPEIEELESRGDCRCTPVIGIACESATMTSTVLRAVQCSAALRRRITLSGCSPNSLLFQGHGLAWHGMT